MFETWAARLSSSLFVGAAIGFAYALSNSRSAHSSSFAQTNVLVCLLCSALAGVIGDEAQVNGQALAFALVGMLGLIRFRTVVRDTKEFITIFLAIVTGISIGANHIALGISVCFLSIASMFALDRWKFGESANGLVRIKLKRRADAAFNILEVLELGNTGLDRIAAKTSEDGMLAEVYEGALPKTWSLSRAIYKLQCADGVKEVSISRQLRFNGATDKDDD